MCLLEWARAHDARYVQVSTDEVYGDFEAGGRAVEDDPLRPSSPYSAAKAGGDLQVLAYVRTYGVRASITRGANTYGPNQYPEKLVPLFVTNALDGRAAARLRRREAGAGMAPRRGSLRRASSSCCTRARPVRSTTSAARITRTSRSPIASSSSPVPTRPSSGTSRTAPVTTAATPSTTPSCGRSAGRPSSSFGEGGLPATVDWYRDNRDWWEPIKSGSYRAYYDEQYANRLKA